MDDDGPEISVLLLGDAEVGKSTFLSRLSNGRDGLQSKQIIPLRDLDQPFVYSIHLFNRPYRLEFSDTASPTNYTLLNPKVVILCYDVSNRATLASIEERWVRTAYIHHRARQPDDVLPILLLGLKRDLRTEDSAATVHPEEAYAVAQRLRCDRYMECSARTGELVKEVFQDIARTAAGTTTSTGGLSAGGCGVM
ncbi:MAG: hypothetical protein M1832_001108 [Thelocarpon impressellum]|nr:MAG: hypothetical protein M1832_001108 [Thelocarpon impressellum]